jgi:PAS domain S-box-containing protein
MLNFGDEGFWAWDLITDRFWLNPYFCKLVGHDPEQGIVNFDFLKSIIHTDDHQQFLDSVLKSRPYDKEASVVAFRLVSRDGNTAWIECKSRNVEFDRQGTALLKIGHLIDMTERKLAEEHLKKLNRDLLTISNCNQALLRATNEMELLSDICHIIVKIGGYRMAWVGYAEDDPEKNVRPVASAGHEEGYLDIVNISWADVERGRGATGTAIRNGKACSTRDMKTDRKFDLWRTEASRRGYASSLSLPLKNEHKVFGALTIYAPAPDAFNAEETTLLSSLADNMAYGISMLQNRKARELAEDELRQSEQRYRSLFQNRHIVMLIVDPASGSIIDANPAAVSYYGWERDELLKMNINRINTLTDGEIKTEMQRAHRLRCNCFSFRHRLADDSIRDVEVVSGPINIQGKSLLYSIVSDVTERKLAQEQFIEGNRRMQYILSAANAGLWEIEIGSGKTLWSDEVWRLYGLEPRSCLPSYENWLNTISQEDRETIRTEAAEALNKGAEFNGTWRVRNADGSVRWLLSKGSPFTDSKGNVLRYVGIVIDITDRKMEEEEKQQLEAQLRKAQRLETIGTLAGGIAHDFNNILTPLLGYAEMGLLTLSSEETCYDYFKEIMQASDRARDLVSQILAFSRAQEITPSVVSVQAVVAEALKLLRPSIPASVTIEKDIDESCRSILADPSQIHQVIVNLCTNAYQAMGDGPGVIRIVIREVVPDNDLLKTLPEPHSKNYLQLSISDTGSGMDGTTMERIFEPFFTTKSIHRGTGLGLSVVHGIITSYNGLITVNSEPGKGTAFRIYLPVIREKRAHVHTEAPPTPGNASILFVDDEQASTRMMTIMLTKLGFRIHALNSPLQALELFRQNPGQFDLVITDLTMPEMNGVDLAAGLHMIKPNIPIILMTGYGKDLENIKALSRYGIRKFIKKPVKMAEISSTINEVISGGNK